jgi:arabinan endo-1,5-alpha-L-arabinosidase
VRIRLVAALLGWLALSGPPAVAEEPEGDFFQPVHTRAFPDPAVTPYDGGYVAVATGRRAVRSTAPSVAGPWTAAPPALSAMPDWATSTSVWAPEIEQVGSRWVLYFSATVNGLGPGGRCIGIAVARRPTDPFVPYGDRPLVCPRAADVPRAPDPVKRPRWMPRTGVIDPSFFRDADGRQYLLYKTMGQPSSLRMVRLGRGGVGIPAWTESRTLLTSAGILENPALVRRPSRYVLFASEGSYANCKYQTTSRISRSLWDWSRAERYSHFRRASTGLCGPGGADVLVEGSSTTLFLHAWVCGTVPVPCPGGFEAGSYPVPWWRPMYAVRLGWYGAIPVPVEFVSPTPVSEAVPAG